MYSWPLIFLPCFWTRDRGAQKDRKTQTSHGGASAKATAPAKATALAEAQGLVAGRVNDALVQAFNDEISHRTPGGAHGKPRGGNREGVSLKATVLLFLIRKNIY